MSCPCGSKKPFEHCCGPYLEGREKAPGAEALMRSRYVAFTRQDMAYLQKTTHPSGHAEFDVETNEEWARKARFTGLEILSSSEKGDEGFVHFRARYRIGLKYLAHEEASIFKRENGIWYFLRGESR